MTSTSSGQGRGRPGPCTCHIRPPDRPTGINVSKMCHRSSPRPGRTCCSNCACCMLVVRSLRSTILITRSSLLMKGTYQSLLPPVRGLAAAVMSGAGHALCMLFERVASMRHAASIKAAHARLQCAFRCAFRCMWRFEAAATRGGACRSKLGLWRRPLLGRWRHGLGASLSRAPRFFALRSVLARPARRS